ncbi:unnamed protein product [Caenorhabditis sp. 36 PRJEB53466]|nr:unnamed protein product [Caenorhabditis sp. 36 PRJEB53466]
MESAANREEQPQEQCAKPQQPQKEKRIVPVKSLDPNYLISAELVFCADDIQFVLEPQKPYDKLSYMGFWQESGFLENEPDDETAWAALERLRVEAETDYVRSCQYNDYLRLNQLYDEELEEEESQEGPPKSFSEFMQEYQLEQQVQRQEKQDLSDGLPEEDPEEQEFESPADTPTFRNANEADTYYIDVNLQYDLVADQTRFVMSNYSSRIDLARQKLKLLLVESAETDPQAQKRVDNASFMGLITVFSEMTTLYFELLANEYNRNPIFPTKLVEEFENFVERIRICYRTRLVDPSNYTALLVFRDRLIESLRNHFRIINPVRMGKQPNFCKKITERYSMADYTFVCGSVYNGKYQLSFAKWLIMARVTEIEINNIRADIIAQANDYDINYPESFRTPLFSSPTNATDLLNDLFSREPNHMGSFDTAMAVIDKVKVNEPTTLRYLKQMTAQSNLRSSIIKKKKNILKMLPDSIPEDYTSLQQVLNTLSAIEALMLLVEKVYEPLFDNKLGIYGKAFPATITILGQEIYRCATIGQCRDGDLSPYLVELLELLRAECMKHIAIFYNGCEKHCEDVYTGPYCPLSNAVPVYPYALEKKDFPNGMAAHVELMMKVLSVQQYEMERLVGQSCRVRRARYMWHTFENTLPFRISTVDNIFTIGTNFDEQMNTPEIRYVLNDARQVLYAEGRDYPIGRKLVEISVEIMTKRKKVPKKNQIEKYCKAEFVSRIGSERLGGRGADELACLISEVINLNIISSKLPYKAVPPAQTEDVAREIASDCVARYVSHARSAAYNRAGPDQARIDEAKAERQQKGEKFGAPPKEPTENDITETSDLKRLAEVITNLESDADDEDEPGCTVVDMMFDALTIAALNRAADRGIVVDGETVEFHFDEDVPDPIIDNFFKNFQRVNLPDLSAPIYNSLD